MIEAGADELLAANASDVDDAHTAGQRPALIDRLVLTPERIRDLAHGVILMIYEARPAVTVDAAALCVKAGNAAILRGSREARRTNACLGGLLGQTPLPDGAVQVIANSDYAMVTRFLWSDGIDLVIPRRNEPLIRSVVEHAAHAGAQALQGCLPHVRGPGR